MRQTQLRLLTCLAVLALMAWPRAQQTARDSGQGATGTAIITGTLVSDDSSNRPIRHAVVTLGAGGGDPRSNRSTATDDQGRFVFPALPAGHYTMYASKPGYVQAYYGAKIVWRSPGAPITVDDGQQLDLAMKMMHGAVIAGMILDTFGHPQPNMRVSVMQFRTVGGIRQPQMFFGGGGVSSATTDSLGGYRLYGLPPGEYIVIASTLSGPPGDTRLVTSGEIQWAQQQSQRIGGATAGSPGAGAIPAPTPGPAMGYAPVYYPGTTDANSATVLTLGPAEERDSVDFPLQWVPTSKIEGTIVDMDGRPAGGVQLNLIGRMPVFVVSPFGTTGRSDSRGNFTLAGITPGDYTIVARSAGRGGPPAGAMPDANGRPGGPAPPRPVLWAQADVAPSGADITGLMLRLQTGLTISGTLAFEGSATPPTDLTKVRLGMAAAPSAGTTTTTVTVGGSQQSVNADGTFTLGGATPGRYRLNGSVPFTPPPGTSLGSVTPTWTLKSVVLNGADTLDTGLEVSTTDVSGVVVTFTDRPTELSGRLLDQAGKPAPEYWVVAFTTNRSLWTQGSRRVRPTRPDADGKYRIASLPAGEYYVIALTDLEQADLYDPTFLEQLAGAATKVTLAEGEKKSQDFKLSGGLRP